MSQKLSKNWINMFDAIFYINMEKSVGRRKHIESEFNHFEGDLIRISAVTPETLGEQKIREIIVNNMSSREPYRVSGTKQSNLNEIALGFSHSNAIDAAIEYYQKTGKSNILIIEDDAVIVELPYNRWAQLGYVHANDYDVWQLGYTIFKENVGSWLLEREYSINCTAIPYGCAKVESGIFGTLGYAINLREDNIDKFRKFSFELSQGSISDFCLSEQKYLNKIIFDEKLLMPLNDQSTISTETGYSAVEEGYTLNAFNEGLVKETNNFDPTIITAHRDSYDNRLAYLIIEHQNIHTSIYHRVYFEEHFEEVIEDAKDLLLKESIENQFNIKRAYVILFDNLSKPNLGKRYFIQQ